MEFARRPLMAGQLEDVQDAGRGARPTRAPSRRSWPASTTATSCSARPFTDLGALVGGDRRHERRGRGPDHALRARGRLHRRGLGADAGRGRRRRRDPGPLRAAPVLRRERHRARPEGARRARPRPAARAVLRRDRRRARRRPHRREDRRPDRPRPRRHHSPTSSPRWRIAYEPIWAIGTGKTATAEIAQETVGLRARSRAREPRGGGRPGARALRRQRQGGATSTSSWRSPTSTACWSAAPASTRPSSPASCASRPCDRASGSRRREARARRPRRTPRSRRPAAPTGRSCWPSSTAGVAPRPARATRSSWPTRPPSTACGRATPHGTLDASGCAVGLPGRPDGQLRGRAPEHRRRAHRLPGPHAHHQGDRRRRLLHATPCSKQARSPRLASAAPRSTSWASSRTAGCTPTWATSRPASTWRAARGVSDVVVHAFLDGRDTPPDSSPRFLADIEEHMRTIGVGRYGTVCGRYYAMDRDNRWDRVALRLRGARLRRRPRRRPTPRAPWPPAAARGETDEFVQPTVIGDPRRAPRARRRRLPVLQLPARTAARELTRAFFEESFAEFDRGPRPPRVDFVTMTRYKKEFPLPVAFEPEPVTHVLAAGAGRARPAPAAHRRDREVRPRDVLLQRRRRARRARASAASWCRARATCPPTTRSPR